MGVVSNCTRCRKIFQRTVSPLCAECYQASLNQIRDINQFMQHASQMTLQEISEGCGISFKEIETLFLSGRLGAAARKVIYPCGMCNQPMPALMMRGRVCQSCAERLETEPSHIEKDEPEKPLQALPGQGGSQPASNDKPGKGGHSTVPSTVPPEHAHRDEKPAPSAKENKPEAIQPQHADEPKRATVQHDSYGFKRLSE